MSAHNKPYDLNLAHRECDDPGSGGTIVVDRYGVTVPMAIAASGETGTLGRPARAGQKVVLVAKSVASGADRTITVTGGVGVDSYTSMLFDAADECVILEGVPSGDDHQWTLIVADGATLS